MIHPTAIIDPSVKLGADVTIGPYAVVGAEVSLGDGCWIGPHALVQGPSKLGKNNKIFQFASVGEVPQDKKYNGEPTELIMGDGNVVRECATIHRGTVQDQGVTKIGNDNLFMANTHVAHDCVVGNSCIFGNSAAIAGHVVVEDHVIITGMSGVHQFCLLGTHSFIAHASIVTKDIPPFVMVTGGASPTAKGINVEGLKRHGFNADEIQALKNAYKIIYRQGLRITEAIEKLSALQQECAVVGCYIHFLRSSHRGIVR